MSDSKVLRRIEQLRNEIEEHNHKYYVQAKPSVSDYDFDMLLEKALIFLHLFDHLYKLLLLLLIHIFLNMIPNC